MYLQIGKNTILRESEILGVFDLDITSQSHLTRKFLAAAEKAGRVINAADDIPKSFLVCQEPGGEVKVYLCQAATATLLRRAETGMFPRNTEREKTGMGEKNV